jgi:hypothetical protein
VFGFSTLLLLYKKERELGGGHFNKFEEKYLENLKR